MKRLTVIILIICMLIIPITTNAEIPRSATTTDKTNLLSELLILTGTSADYRLNEQMTRGEAAAFAVRLMGQELHVLSNSESYRNTAFPDVKATDWYAPYVGYCSQNGIISGDTTGYYKPYDLINEKSFLKIVLSILGYSINSDYTWGGVFVKAFEVGLVTDLSYIAKTDENDSFKRLDAVNAIYNALFLSCKGSDKELFYKLIDAGIITISEATKLGLIKDELITEITNVDVNDATSVTVYFNENIGSIGSVKIYETTNPTKLLDCQIDVLSDEYVILKTSAHTSEVEYTIEIMDVEDTEGNKQTVLNKNFVGYIPIEIESDFFRIKKIEPVNNNSVLIYFTQPLNINSEISINYKIYRENNIFADGAEDKLITRVFNQTDNSLLLSLRTGTFQEGELYQVIIGGELTGAYGVKLNNGFGDGMEFVAAGGQDEKFKLDEVSTYGEGTLLLSFNKEINPALAQQIFNFYVTDKDGKPMAVENTLTLGPVLFINIKDRFIKNELYYVTINNLNDITRKEYISEMTYSVKAEYDSTSQIHVSNVESTDEQTVIVYFSESLDEASANNINNYSIYSKSSYSTQRPNKIYFNAKQEPNKVILYFNNDNSLVGNNQYELRVSSSIKTYMGKTSGKTLTSVFHASYNRKVIPIITEAVPVSLDAVKLVFDKELAFDYNNLSPENYTLEYSFNGMTIKKVPLGVLYINAKTLVLKFDKLEYEIPYTLKFNTLMDYSGVSFKVTGEGTNYVEFKVEKND